MMNFDKYLQIKLGEDYLYDEPEEQQFNNPDRDDTISDFNLSGDIQQKLGPAGIATLKKLLLKDRQEEHKMETWENLINQEEIPDSEYPEPQEFDVDDFPIETTTNDLDLPEDEPYMGRPDERGPLSMINALVGGRSGSQTDDMIDTSDIQESNSNNDPGVLNDSLRDRGYALSGETYKNNRMTKDEQASDSFMRNVRGQGPSEDIGDEPPGGYPEAQSFEDIPDDDTKGMLDQYHNSFRTGEDNTQDNTQDDAPEISKSKLQQFMNFINENKKSIGLGGAATAGSLGIARALTGRSKKK